MSKTEIIAELAHLSPEDLSDVKAWLDRMSSDKAGSRPGGTGSAHIRTPRLANRAQLTDFTKQITELPTNAAI